MAQHDGNIANQTMPSARTDINNALSAIFTLQSGTSAPSVTFANMFWVDTTNNLLKQRNLADSAWLVKYVLDSNGVNRINAGNPNGSITGNYEGELLYDTTNDLLWAYLGSSTNWTKAVSRQITTTKTANYTATIADDIIFCDATSGSFTVTLYAASGNAGRRLTIAKTDSSLNTVTVDGNASETICGNLALVLGGRRNLNLICDGTNWIHAENQVPLGFVNLAGVAVGTFTSLMNGYFRSYRVELDKVVPSTDQVNLLMNTSSNNSTFDSGASDFQWGGFNSAISSALNDFADSAINLILNGAGLAANRLSNVANEGGFSGIINMFRPQDANYFTCTFQAMYNGATSFPGSVTGGGQRLAAADVDAFQISNSAGTNFTSGTATLYGVV